MHKIKANKSGVECRNAFWIEHLHKKLCGKKVYLMKSITVPIGRFATEEDAAAVKRREIAERLKKGESVNVTPSGQIVEPNDPQAQLNRTLKAPEGKLA